MTSTKRQVVLITGATSGLGKETAKLLSLHGHQVVILAPDAKKVAAVAKSIGCVGLVGDIADVVSVHNAVAEVVKKFKRIDVLVNNAGIWLEGELTTNDPAEIKRVIDVNTTGTILMTHAVVPMMKKAKQGLIINVISQAGLSAKPKRAPYYASKWALTGFTKCLQTELPAYGIRVTGVYPGFMATPLFETSGFKRKLDAALDPKEAAKAIAFVVEASPETHIPELGIVRRGEMR